MTTTSFAHRALVYETVEQQADVLAPLIEQALDTGESVVAVLDRPCLDQLHDRIGPRFADRIRVEVHSPVEIYQHPARTLSSIVDLVRSRIATGGGATVVGETHLGHPLMDHRTWAQVEAVVNDVLGSLPVTLVCSYHRHRTAEFLTSAEHTHPEIYLDGQLRPSRGFVEPTDYLTRHQPAPADPPPHARTLALHGPPDLRDIRQQAATAATAAGLARAQVEDFVLAVAELSTNSVEHGHGPCRMLLWNDLGEVGCDITNSGGFTNPLRGFAPPTPTQPRGRGLYLARQLCDSVTLWADGDQVRVQARLGRAVP